MEDIFRYMKQTSKEVDKYILKFISEKIKDRKIQQIVLYLPEIMNKQPKITATFGRLIYELMSNKNFKEIIPFLASIELGHTSTYVLDDIMDNQPIRQNRKASWKEFGLNYGITAGNLQSFLSKRMIYDTKLNNEQILTMSKLIDEMWIILWIGQGKNEGMKEGTTYEEYIERCYEIAGIMLSCIAKMIAISCNKKPEEIGKIGKIGEFYGIAAMIRNDLMNLIPQNLVKKGRSKALLRYEYEDVRKGLWTFPIIFSMKKIKDKERSYLNSTLGKKDATDEEVIKLTKILVGCGAIEETLKLITRYKEKTKNIINELFPISPKKQLLLNFIEQLENSRVYFKKFKKQF